MDIDDDLIVQEAEVKAAIIQLEMMGAQPSS
jgi:hypothetical protein